MADTVRVDERDGVATITMTRPPVNALDAGLLDALEAALDQVERSPSARVVVFRSEGTRAFCAGADLAMMARAFESPDELVAFVGRVQELFDRIESQPVPTIAELGAPATGGGFELALACDLRLAGRDVRLGVPEMNVGLIPGAGGTQRLVDIAGRGLAYRMVLTGELVTGAEAERLGLVQWAVDGEVLEQTTWALAERLARKPGQAIGLAKECIRLARSQEGFDRELSATRELLANDETSTLVRDFLAHREGQRRQP